MNLLFDPSQIPHIKSSELYEWFGISQSTGNGKSKLVRDLFEIAVFDSKWTLPSRMERNPMAWMICLDGIVVDVRRCAPEIQAAAYKKGLIPYLPGVNNPEDSKGY